MRAATCFSGIGAPETSAPWATWLWASEVEPFANAVLSERHPATANLGDVLAGDFLDRARAFGPLDLLVAGPPCQAFSIAGLRRSLDDARGNLTLRWVQVIHAIDPRWAVTENVPGWLSTKDNAFGCFLAGLVGADDPLRTPDGGSWPDAGMVAGPLGRAAWRVLDAQHFGVPQRRRRVFVVFSTGGRGDPAAVLFERHCLSGDHPAGGEAREDVAGALTASLGGVDENDAAGERLTAFGGNNQAGPINVATARNAHSSPHGRLDFESETFVVATTLRARDGAKGVDSDATDTLITGTIDASMARSRGAGTNPGALVGALSAQPGAQQQTYLASGAVRRLTPVECERLQGFPDGWTDVLYRGKPAADGPRYKAIGNSMAVPVMTWIIERIRIVDEMRQVAEAA